MKNTYDVLIIGGGAAGFFTAINTACKNKGLKIAILERGKKVLTKVRISGGGRCNVTHAEFIPSELTQNYPRGKRELLGPFHRFMTGDVMEWFISRGVELKTEEDGRVFPVSDSSETIINCFLSETERLGIQLFKNHAVRHIKIEQNQWQLDTSTGTFFAEKIVLATGSNPKIWKLVEQLGHRVTPPVPSLFTFNTTDKRIEGLAGISTFASVAIEGEVLQSEGALLITHWGLSGPGILKLSAWGARILHHKKYTFTLCINWLGNTPYETALNDLKKLRIALSKKQLVPNPAFELPKRLWKSLAQHAGIKNDQKWAELSNLHLQKLASELTRGSFLINGKSTFKEEFVTAGGINLNEIDCKTFESKKHKNLYFAGEILNIDAITGGFNFQNAWTGGYLAAQAITATE